MSEFGNSDGELSDPILHRCQICINDEFEEGDMFTNHCGHEMCKDCFHTFLRTNIEAKTYPIQCPFNSYDPCDFKHKRCGSNLSPHLCLSKLAGIDDQETHDQFTTLLIQHDSRDLIHFCANKHCGTPFEWCNEDDNDFFIENEHLRYHVYCPLCSTSSCVRCKSLWHQDQTCEEFQSKGKENENERKFLSLIKTKNWNVCPKCGHAIEKTYGCDHMTCRVCHSHFDYKNKNFRIVEEALKKKILNSGQNQDEDNTAGHQAGFSPQHDSENRFNVSNQSRGGGQRNRRRPGRGRGVIGNLNRRGNISKNYTTVNRMRHGTSSLPQEDSIPLIVISSSDSENETSEAPTLQHSKSTKEFVQTDEHIPSNPKRSSSSRSLSHSKQVSARRHRRNVSEGQVEIEKIHSIQVHKAKGKQKKNQEAHWDAREILRKCSTGTNGFVSLHEWLVGIQNRRLPLFMHAAVSINRCPYRDCGEKFGSLKRLENHLCGTREHQVWLCCGRPFQSRKNMGRHICLNH